MPENVSIRLHGKLAMDTSQAEQAAREYRERAQAEIQKIQETIGQTPALQLDARSIEAAKQALEDLARQAEQLRRAHVGTPPAGGRSWQEQMAESRGFLPVPGRTATDILREREQANRGLPGPEFHGPPRPPRLPMDPYEDVQARSQANLTWVNNELGRILGATGKIHDHNREIAALVEKQRKAVRELREEWRQAERVAKEQETDRAKDLAYTLRQAYETTQARSYLLQRVVAQRRADEAVGGAMQGKGSLEGLTIQQAMSGGALGALFAGAGRFIMRHPLLAIPAIVGGTALWAEGKASEMAKYSEDIDLAFLNTGRRTGMGPNLRRFYEPRPGQIRPEFERLGYAGEHVARLVDAYGMPTSPNTLLRATEAQARFARAYGFGDSPEMIAALGRRVTQLGTAEPAQQGQFWALMAAAVEKGMRQGVDASETMKALLAMTEHAAAQTGTVSREYVAGLASIQGLLTGGGRFFAGERGAQQVTDLLAAFQRPQSVAQQRFIQQAILGHFGGRAPSAQELGLTGYAGRSYGHMTEIQQLEYVQQMLPELLLSGNARVRQLLPTIARSLGAGSGAGGEQLMFQAVFGMEPAKGLKAQQALADAVEKLPGMTPERVQQMGPFDLLAALFERGQGGDARRILSGTTPSVELSKVEQLRLKDTQIMEAFSAAVSEASPAFREAAKDIKKAAADWLATLAGRPVESLNRSSVERVAREKGVPVAALRGLAGARLKEEALSEQELSTLAEQVRQMVKGLSPSLRDQFLADMAADEKLGRAPTPQALEWWRQQAAKPGKADRQAREADREGAAISDWILEREERQQGKPYPQAWSPGEAGRAPTPQALDVRIQAAGEIRLVGEGVAEGVSLPADALIPFVLRALEQERMGMTHRSSVRRRLYQTGMTV